MKYILLLISLFTTFTASAQLNSVVSFHFENKKADMTINSPIGVATVDMGPYSIAWHVQNVHALGTYETGILISDDCGEDGRPLWYAYFVQDWAHNRTFEVHMPGLVAFDGHSLHTIYTLQRPPELQEVINFCGY